MMGTKSAPTCWHGSRSIPVSSLKKSNRRSARRNRSSQLPHLCFQQRPALGAELALPVGVDARQLGAEGGLVDLVEGEAAGGKALAQAGVEIALILALLAHVFGGIALDYRLDVSRQALPSGEMRHQVVARPHVIGHADI